MFHRTNKKITISNTLLKKFISTADQYDGADVNRNDLVKLTAIISDQKVVYRCLCISACVELLHIMRQ